MEDNDCPVTSSSEAPFFMSQLLSKLDPKDNAEFGREMKRNKKEETIPNLIQWLHEEASLRSRGKLDLESSFEEQSQQRGSFNRRTDNYAGDFDVSKDGPCPLGCQAKHPLAVCPRYQTSIVDQRWEIVKQNQRCRKCLRSHHTKDCKKSDGTTCDKCKKNHHRSLHNERKDQEKPPLDPNAVPAQTHNDNTINNNADMNTLKHNGDVKTVAGLLPVQKIKVENLEGEPVEILAMLDTGSNTSLLSKAGAKKLGLSGPKTHLIMNLAGGSKISETSEIIEITLVSPSEEHIKKPLLVHTVMKPCSSARTISKSLLKKYDHLSDG